MHYFIKLLTKNQTSPLLNYLKGNTSRSGSTREALLPDIGQYWSSLFHVIVVVAFISIF